MAEALVSWLGYGGARTCEREGCGKPINDQGNVDRWGYRRYKRSDTRYCSKSCRQKASRARKKAERPCCQTCGQVLPPEQPAKELPGQLGLLDEGTR